MIKLKDRYVFDIEIKGKNARLLVYDGGVEKVCRKTTLKALFGFIQTGENHLFKGRLQLIKKAGTLAIAVKGELVGEITTGALLNCLRKDHL
jgi:hypothetical protein